MTPSYKYPLQENQIEDGFSFGALPKDLLGFLIPRLFDIYYLASYCNLCKFGEGLEVEHWKDMRYHGIQVKVSINNRVLSQEYISYDKMHLQYNDRKGKVTYSKYLQWRYE